MRPIDIAAPLPASLDRAEIGEIRPLYRFSRRFRGLGYVTAIAACPSQRDL